MILKGYNYVFSEDKNKILKAWRNITFEEIIIELENYRVIDDFRHPNRIKYPKQRIFVVRIREYVYMTPYVVDAEKKEIFLKTIYRSRSANKKYENK